MPIRRLNYTNRKRLKLGDISIIVRASKDIAPSFGARLDLSDYSFPPDANVFIEAYRQAMLMRFPCGTVGALICSDNQTLKQFESTEDVLFRVKVVAACGNAGIILGEADQIRPSTEEQRSENREPLLPVHYDPGLRDLPFRLSFEGEKPVILINGTIPGRESFGSSTEFLALVFPQILREILTRVLLIEQWEFDSTEGLTPDYEDDDWRNQWLRFSLNIPGVTNIPPPDEKGEQERISWIDDTVAAFARRLQVMEAFHQFWDGKER